MQNIGKKNIYTSQTSIFIYFFFFSSSYKFLVEMITETYGSFRVEFLYDEEGEILRGDSLFFNIYDLWSVHRSGFLLGTYDHKVTKLRKIIKRKWKGQKKLPGFNILMRKIKEGDEVFNLIEFLEGDHVHFFQKLQEWKQNFENTYLKQHPFLRKQIRHKKIYIKPSWVKRYR